MVDQNHRLVPSTLRRRRRHRAGRPCGVYRRTPGGPGRRVSVKPEGRKKTEKSAEGWNLWVVALNPEGHPGQKKTRTC